MSAYDSFYEIEPYTGLTTDFAKKLMMNAVVIYDELYDKISITSRGEIIPYFSLYSYAKMSKEFT